MGTYNLELTSGEVFMCNHLLEWVDRCDRQARRELQSFARHDSDCQSYKVVQEKIAKLMKDNPEIDYTVKGDASVEMQLALFECYEPDGVTRVDPCEPGDVTAQMLLDLFSDVVSQADDPERLARVLRTGAGVRVKRGIYLCWLEPTDDLWA